MQNVPFAAQQEQVNKFLQANRALGAQMDQMQGTTRIIYDTYNFTGRTTADYFSEVSSKQGTATFINGQPATNITDNRFEPGEGMVIKEVGIFNLDNSATPSTPASMGVGVIGLALLNIYIGNNRVVKDLPIFLGGALSPLNNLNPVSGSADNNITRRTSVVRLLTNIVIPPQVQFYANLRLPVAPAETDSASANGLRVYFKGYGKLFNPRNNY